MKIILGADHAGVNLKKKIKQYLDKKKIWYEDVGGFNSKQKDDYPDYAVKAARIVAKEKDSKGILICGTGTGMVIAANKVKGIRASMCYDIYSAKMARHDNDANVLTLRGRGISFDKTKKIISTWLNTKFSGKPRHKRRIQKVDRIQ